MLLLAVFSVIAAVSGALADTTFVCGDVSGVWDTSGSPYYITDSVCVPSGDSLRIGPGVEVIFQGHYKFCVDSAAVLKAIGTAEDSIVFTAEDTTEGYNGLRIYKTEICTLAYCSFTYGKTSYRGGAVSARETEITITHCLFRNNRAIDDSLYGANGGALYLRECYAYILRSTFENNEAIAYGGAIEVFYGVCYVYGSSFYNNKSTWSGSAIRIYTNESSVIIENNIFFGNMGAGYGAVVSCSTSANQEVVIKGNIFVNNKYSGPIYIGWNNTAYIENNIIVDNIHHSVWWRYSGAICCESDTLYMINNTLQGNYNDSSIVTLGFHGKMAVLLNNTFDRPDTGETPIIYVYNDYYSSCSLYIAYCNIDSSRCEVRDTATGAIIWGTGNIDADPLFADTAAGDYHLLDGSPCIDAGAESIYIAIWDTVIYAPTADIDGNPRPFGHAWDIGACESPYSPSWGDAITIGWNLLSYPYTGVEFVSVMYPFADPVVFSFDPAIGYYNLAEVTAGSGYWILSHVDTLIDYIPPGVSSIDDTLIPGWNLLGAVDHVIPLGGISTTPAGLIIGYPWGFNGSTGMYESADSLHPGRGYWFLSSGHGRITVGP